MFSDKITSRLIEDVKKVKKKAPLVHEISCPLVKFLPKGLLRVSMMLNQTPLSLSVRAPLVLTM